MPLDWRVIGQGLDPVQAQQQGFVAGQMGLDYQQRQNQMQTQRALQDLAARSDLSTPEGMADYQRQYSRLVPPDPMALAQAGQKQALTAADIQQKQAQAGQERATSSYRAAQEQDLLKQQEEDRKKKMYEEQQGFYGFISRSAQAASAAANDNQFPPSVREDRARAILAQAKQDAQRDFPDFYDRLEKFDPSTADLKSLPGFSQQMQAHLAQQPKTYTPESGAGKAESDYQHGLITRKQADAEIAKATAPPASVQINMPAKGDFSRSGDDYLESLPADERELVKGIAEYRINPQTLSTRGGHREKVLSEVSQYDRDYDQKQYGARSKVVSDFTSGKTANNITAINTAIGHMGTLDAAAKAMENNNVQAENAIVNAVRNQFGDPKINNFELARQAVGNELMRVFRQVGASESETKDFEQRFASKMSPAQLRGAIKTASELLESRINALGDQWERGMGSKKGLPPIVSPHSQQVLDSLKATPDSVRSYSDPDKERRYQEWKRSHGQ